jgi:hypothetical protein
VNNDLSQIESLLDSTKVYRLLSEKHHSQVYLARMVSLLAEKIMELTEKEKKP